MHADAAGGPVPAIGLNDGRSIPQLGFGVFQVPPEDTAEVTGKALEIGYRHIDTAEMYGTSAGWARRWPRPASIASEVWVTSKLNNGFHRPDDARRAFEGTLKELGLDYVDLFLIHWPLPTLYGGDFVSTWETLIEFHDDGRARSIGVSNFQPHHLDRLLAETDTVPAVNQIEIHPYLRQDDLRAYDVAHGIATEAWSPIAQGRVLDDPAMRRWPGTWPDAGPGGAALAPPARRHRVPEVGHARPDAGELRDLRLRARPRRHGHHQRAEPGRTDGPGPGHLRLRAGLTTGEGTGRWAATGA